MRILHTSDWHIGKRLFDRERLDEQAAALDEIVCICEREQIELVLIAGDIFDTYTPSAEAEELFYSKIKKIAGADRAVLIISGNHDDGVRLSAAAPLAVESGIYIVGNSRSPLPVSKGLNGRLARPIESGKGYATFENKQGERVFISTLPYPNEARFKEEKSDLPYVEQMKKWIRESEDYKKESTRSIFMAHIFVAGGVSSDSEREISLGGARALPIEALPASDYIALGHLHKKQKMGKGHCYYSGSLLQYSFDETSEKSVKIFNLTGAGVEDLQDVLLQSGRKLVRLECTNIADAHSLLEQYPNSLVELTLRLSEPLTSLEAAELSKRKNLVSLLTDVQTQTDFVFESRKNLGNERLFEEFYRSQYGVEPDAELKQLFLQVMSEIEHS
ncbi:MAG: exonuclease subunit SbcD [Clostridia bacterium]|nr:exonuclease subunit SbcD [Clostridia bacterium]